MRIAALILALLTGASRPQDSPDRTGTASGTVVSKTSKSVKVSVTECSEAWKEMLRGRTRTFKVPYVARGGDWVPDDGIAGTVKGLAKGAVVSITFWAGDKSFWIEGIEADGSGGPPAKAGPIRIEKWADFDGIQATIEADYVLRTDMTEADLKKIIARIRELRPFFTRFYGEDIGEGWVISLFRERAQYEEYAAKIKNRKGVQGQCRKDLKQLTICDPKGARGGYLTVLSHEYAHAFLDARVGMWANEGHATMLEVSEKGKVVFNKYAAFEAKKYKITDGHYDDSLRNAFAGKKFDPEGWGYSYGVGWSIHYFLHSKDPEKYRTMLKKLESAKYGEDLSEYMKMLWGMTLDELDAAWDGFVKNLKA